MTPALALKHLSLTYQDERPQQGDDWLYTIWVWLKLLIHQGLSGRLEIRTNLNWQSNDFKSMSSQSP